MIISFNHSNIRRLKKMNKKSAIRKKPSQEAVDNFINKGIQDESTANTKNSTPKSKDEISRVQLRLSKGKLEEIDDALNKRKVKVSRHVWLLEAIEEKLEREKLD